jgi:hypothetical protein
MSTFRSVLTPGAAVLLAVLAVASCAHEPTAVNPADESPALAVTQRTAGGLSFTAGSGCTLVLSHFECSFTVEGVGTHLHQVSQRGGWTYTYQCLHKKTLKQSRQPPAPGFASAIILQSGVTGSNDQITVTGTVLAPSAPRDCEANKGAFTVTQMVTAFIPNQWSILVSRSSDPDNFFASMFEVL